MSIEEKIKDASKNVDDFLVQLIQITVCCYSNLLMSWQRQNSIGKTLWLIIIRN